MRQVRDGSVDTMDNRLIVLGHAQLAVDWPLNLTELVAENRVCSNNGETCRSENRGDYMNSTPQPIEMSSTDSSALNQATQQSCHNSNVDEGRSSDDSETNTMTEMNGMSGADLPANTDHPSQLNYVNGMCNMIDAVNLNDMTHMTEIEMDSLSDSS